MERHVGRGFYEDSKKAALSVVLGGRLGAATAHQPRGRAGTSAEAQSSVAARPTGPMLAPQLLNQRQYGDRCDLPLSCKL